MEGSFLILVLFFGVITGALGSWVAGKKGRKTSEGFLLGFFFSIIGLIIEGLLPQDRPALPVQGEKRCPFCAEIIKYQASICRFCGKELPSGPAEESAQDRVARAQQKADNSFSLARVFIGVLVGIVLLSFITWIIFQSQ